VVTEGVLTRMIQSDPGLAGVSAVIFDEIHERNLQSDLGLALCLEAQAALRPDLRLLAMSATLDAAPIAALMGGAPVLRAEGRAWPVDIRWAERPLPDRRPATLAAATAEAVLAALAEREGDVLAFLPGAGEIGRCAARLADALPAGVALHRLLAAAPQAEQRAALAPSPGRKVVLATAIAETSLTVPGVRIVIDAGAARRARHDPASGMSRLVTERVSRAEATQRAGRAGREAPGLCVRLWTRGEEGALAAFAPPEIAVADLAALALDLAAWGAEPSDLPFLDQPPAGALAEARALLAALGALDAGGRITARGRAMAALPLHPRLAAMVLDAGTEAPTARLLAALLTEGDPLRVEGGTPGADIALRVEAVADPARFQRMRSHALNRALAESVRDTARRLGPCAPADPAAAGRLLAAAYPDRIARRREGTTPRFLLSGGKGAVMAEGDGLAGAPWLVAADLDGDPREARMRLAAALSPAEAAMLAATKGMSVRSVAWDGRARAVTARAERRLGAIVVESRPMSDADPDAVTAAMLDGVRDLGLGCLPWTPAASSLRDRIAWLAGRGQPDLPDWSDAGLLAALDEWLGPWVSGMRREGDLAALDMLAVLRAALGPQAAVVEAAAPAVLVTPAGPTVPIDYGRAQPTVAVRAQWLYGLERHPAAAGVPVVIELLSPAQRPVATTADLPGFWRGAWGEVRKEMRGRYPRHEWPERPWEAAPTTRARPRG
jgi:ATP-dependent helicase HrpB